MPYRRFPVAGGKRREGIDLSLAGRGRPWGSRSRCCADAGQPTPSWLSSAAGAPPCSNEAAMVGRASTTCCTRAAASASLCPCSRAVGRGPAGARHPAPGPPHRPLCAPAAGQHGVGGPCTPALQQRARRGSRAGLLESLQICGATTATASASLCPCSSDQRQAGPSHAAAIRGLLLGQGGAGAVGMVMGWAKRRIPSPA